jgi:hypothetical protein
LSATQLADKEHAVVPLVIVTAVPTIVQPPFTVITAGLLELVVAVTGKVVL